MLAGAVLMLRRDAVEACGGLFDESFFMYFEDAQLSDRLRAGGGDWPSHPRWTRCTPGGMKPTKHR